MVSSIFQTIGEVITNLASTIKSAIEGVLGLFIETTEQGAFSGFTFVGTLLLIVVGGGLVYWAIRLIMGLVRGVGAKA